jgi:hypothetical protein
VARAIASRIVVRTATTEMSAATILARDRMLVVATIDAAIRLRRNEDERVSARRAANPVEARIALRLKLVDVTIDVPIRLHRNEGARMSAHRVANPIVVLIALLLKLVDATTDVPIRHRRNEGARISAHRVVNRIEDRIALVLNRVVLMIDVATHNRRSMDLVTTAGRLTIAADSFLLAVATEPISLHLIAAVTTEDAATSARHSVDRIMTATAWDHHPTIVAVARIVVLRISFRHTAVPIVDAAISVLRSMNRAVIVATMDRRQEIAAANVMAVVPSHRCEIHSAFSATDETQIKHGFAKTLGRSHDDRGDSILLLLASLGPCFICVPSVACISVVRLPSLCDTTW